MIVFRIVHEKWSNNLLASGNEARWNSEGNLVIYTSGSRALACLENFVHRSGETSRQLFKTMVIEIPDYIKMDEISTKQLPGDWHDRMNFSFTRSLGDAWLRSLTSAVLKIPSAIIREENNYLLNPMHKDFKKIKLKGREDFRFDPRTALYV